LVFLKYHEFKMKFLGSTFMEFYTRL